MGRHLIDAALIINVVDGSLLWFLSRGSGLVLLGLLTLSTLLGVLSAGARAGSAPRQFVSQALHRNVSLLSVVFLAVHVATAVIDDYVDIRWWQVFSPIGATYQPLWLGFGALALDLILVVVISSLVRVKMSHRPWRWLHLTSYAAWMLGLVHGIGIGTDMAGLGSLGVQFSVGCAVLVGAAVALRVLTGSRAVAGPSR
jgi:sulfoxide reductase heme-binding subunit YedZ